MSTDYDVDHVWNAVYNNERDEVRNILDRVFEDAYLEGHRDGVYDAHHEED